MTQRSLLFGLKSIIESTVWRNENVWDSYMNMKIGKQLKLKLSTDDYTVAMLSRFCSFVTRIFTMI